MEWVTMVVALIGAVTGSIALVWQAKNEMRRIEVVFLGQVILLINHTKRPVNIDAVGFEYRDGTSMSVIEMKFESLCTVPAEDQMPIDIGDAKGALNAKYAFARDVCGKTYRRKIHKSEVQYYVGQD